MQTATAMSGTLRILTGIGLLLVPLWAGIVHRPYLIILPLAVTFAISFVMGRWRPWAKAIREGNLGKALMTFPMTLVIQAILVSLLYLIGLGIAALRGGPEGFAAFGAIDIWVPVVAGLVGGLSGLVISQLERPTVIASMMGDGDLSEKPRYEITLLDTPVTPETLFSGIHYSHGTYLSKEEGGGFDNTPSEKSSGRSDEQITKAEGALGRALPEGLIALYKFQNGGSLNQVCVPKDGVSKARHYDDIISPFSGYNDLYPLERIRTVHDSVTDYADPDDPDDADNFPEGCKQMLVLAQWYRETLFLDYNQPGAPRVGFTDWDTYADGGWKEICVWWDDFESFFAALRLYQDTD